MKIFLIILTGIALLATQITQAEKKWRPDAQSFLLRFSPSVDLTGLKISYHLTGLFGGYGNFIRTKPGAWEYVIDTVYEGKAAETLKAIIYCPGYGIELLSIPALDALSSREADVELKPLPSNPLSGRIDWPKDRDIKEAELEVIYIAYWSQEFYGITDGPAVTFKVASASVDLNGSFSLRIPDFSQDPAVNSFESRGVLKLGVREPKPGNMPYRLERSDQPGRDVEFDIAERHNADLILNAKPNRNR